MKIYKPQLIGCIITFKGQNKADRYFVIGSKVISTNLTFNDLGKKLDMLKNHVQIYYICINKNFNIFEIPTHEAELFDYETNKSISN